MFLIRHIRLKIVKKLAGVRFELTFTGNEPVEIPLLHPAYLYKYK